MSNILQVKLVMPNLKLEAQYLHKLVKVGSLSAHKELQDDGRHYRPA